MKQGTVYIVLALVLAACSASEPVAGGSSVKIEGWPGGSGSYSIASFGQILASGSVDQNGQFSYRLANPINQVFLGVRTGCAFVPSDTKTADGAITFKHTNEARAVVRITSIEPGRTKQKVGDGAVLSLTYFDKDVQATGICFSADSSNLTLKTGWNWIWFEVDAVDNQGNPIGSNTKSGTSLPNHFKWYYQGN